MQDAAAERLTRASSRNVPIASALCIEIEPEVDSGWSC